MIVIRKRLGVILSGVAAGALVAPMQAQGQAVADPSTPAAAVDRTAPRRFDIPAGDLAGALNAWSRQSGRSILFQAGDLKGRRTPGARGRMSSDAALNALLSGSGLLRYDDDNGSVALTVGGKAAENANNATPDILVTGRRSWSLNTGVQRSQDDSQPFIVMTREEIQRSGAPNLESFLRDRLNVNASPGTSEQTKPGVDSRAPAVRGLSSINLRGLGSRDTLILVDGRRQPGVNVGSGTITQASITGIPLAAIERIEVLASSASGIYGSGASGGVVNIVLKRDFSGGDVTATYSDTSDFAQGQGQVDITYGLPIEGGRTRISATGSWLKTLPLPLGERAEFINDGIERILANDPTALQGRFTPPPNGTTPNFKSGNGRPLQLKPAFGGTTLTSGIGSIPAGYRGVALDGIAPLLAGIGSYNYQLPDTATSQGARSPLLFGSERISGTVSVRRTFNRWLTGYVGLTLSRSDSVDIQSLGLTYVDLAANAPNNPFVQAIQVALPGVGGDARIRNRQRAGNLIGGVIAQLPGNWQAALDLSYSRTRFDSDTKPPIVNNTTANGLGRGVQDVLRDVNAYPITVAYDDVPFYTSQTPGRSSTFAPSLRIAGPLPLTLPGGQPQMTVNVEYSDERIAAVSGAFATDASSTVSFTPAASQKTRSIYGEIAFPLVGEANKVPLVRQFELRISARAESYTGDGADPFPCLTSDGSLPAGDPFAGCPPEGAAIRRSTTSNSRIDPSISMRWTVFRPLVLRGSYTTGYLPPTLAQLVPMTGNGLNFLTDPLRGNEQIGSPSPFGGGFIDATFGGNPDVQPESSKTLSAGAIFTPGFLPGLRVSADWTRIRKRNVYFDPVLFLIPSPFAQAGFNQLLATYPDRATRGPATGGFAAGPITNLDLSLVNLVGVSTEAVDFVVDYQHALLGGTLDVVSRATYTDSLLVETFPGQPPADFAGVAPVDFAAVAGAGLNGTLRWRGNAAVNWSKGPLTLGWQGRYFDRYALNAQRTVVPGLQSSYVKSQFYQDISASYRFDFGATLRFGINNVLNRKPPLDTTAIPLYYSRYGDPRLRNFYLGINKSF